MAKSQRLILSKMCGLQPNLVKIINDFAGNVKTRGDKSYAALPHRSAKSTQFATVSLSCVYAGDRGQASVDARESWLYEGMPPGAPPK